MRESPKSSFQFFLRDAAEGVGTNLTGYLRLISISSKDNIIEGGTVNFAIIVFNESVLKKTPCRFFSARWVTTP